MSILESIYYEWNSGLEGDSTEVIKAHEELSIFDEGIKTALSENFFKYDDAVMDVISAHQKLGFMAGFEIARQLMAGGKAA